MLAFFDEGATLPQILEIVLLDLLLAGDNAVVIALAVRLLAKREQMLGRLWGTAGAVALRIVFLAVATQLLAIPWLQLVAGVLLLWIAYKLLTPDSHGVGSVEGGAEAVEEISPASSLRSAVRIIVIADASMSLDNVFAVTGAASGNLWLAAAGIALSIPLVVWGSQVLGYVMERHRWVVWIGGAVLGHVAGVLMLGEPALGDHRIAHANWHPLTLASTAGFFVYGWWMGRRARRRAAAAIPKPPA